jgi:hypothetical protein
MEGDSSLERKLSTLITAIKNSQTSEKEVIDMLQSNTNINEYDIETYLDNIDTYTEQRQENMKKIYDLTLSLESTKSIETAQSLELSQNMTEAQIKEYQKQAQLLSINEQRLTELKQKTEVFHKQKKNKSRNILIKDYYRKYYRAWSGYMGLFFCILLVNIIISYIVHKQYLPLWVLAIVIPISILILLLFSSDLRKRDTHIFDEYDWNFDPNEIKLDTYDSKETSEPIAASEEEASASKCAAVAASIKESGGTIQCQEGKVYDETLFKCVDKPTTDETDDNATVEGYSNYTEYKSIRVE